MGNPNTTDQDRIEEDASTCVSSDESGKLSVGDGLNSSDVCKDGPFLMG